MKKGTKIIIISLLSVLLLVIGVIYAIPFFKPLEMTDRAEKYEYTVYGDHVEIEWYVGDEEEVIIPRTFYGRPVTVINEFAFHDKEKIRSVIIPESVKEIRLFAFSKCVNLEEVKLPAELHKLPAGVFDGCTKLERIYLPETIESIGSQTFENCVSLEEIQIPEGVKAISSYAFAGCERLENVNIPTGAQIIEGTSFYGTPWLENQKDKFVIAGNDVLIHYNGDETEVTIPEEVTYIGGELFKNNTFITKVVVPKSVEEISYEAFGGCNNLEYLIIRNSNIVLGRNIVLDSEKVTIVSVEGSTAQEYAEENGIPWMELQE